MLRTLAVIGAAIGTIGLTTASWAESVHPMATDFSAQQKKRGGGQPAARVQVNRPTVNRVQVNRPVVNRVQVNKNINRVQVNKNINVNVNRNNNKVIRAGQGINNPQVNNPQFKKLGGPGGPGGPGLKPQFVGSNKITPLKLGPGQAKPIAFKPNNFPVVKLGGNKIVPIWKAGPKKIYWGGKWKTFVPLAAIGAVVVGGAYYYADSYVTVARPYCGGITPDGCRLNWQMVNFEEGDSEWQCVQYCSRPGAPPPMQTGACELSIFSEPGFGGTNATSSDEQPRLAELGWANQIASVKVTSGTWDFFTEPDFTGEVQRFAPGEYPDLGPDWSRKAASFMCVQP